MVKQYAWHINSFSPPPTKPHRSRTKPNELGIKHPVISRACPSLNSLILGVARIWEAHLWYISPNKINDKSLLNQYIELLSSSEKEDVFRVSGDQLKKRVLLSRALIRTTIARYQTNHHIDPRSLKFKKNEHGKPQVDWQYVDPPPLHFNISHTSSLIACGVTVDSSIGIDVEEKQRRLKNDILAFAKRYFSPYEAGVLATISDPETCRKEFIKLWTLKEAYVKALGKGFSSVPFKTFTIRFKGGMHEKKLPGGAHFEIPQIIVAPCNELENQSRNWQFTLMELAGSHYAAICLERASGTASSESIPMKVKVWNTIPFVEDRDVSETDAALVIGGLSGPLDE